jgi:hypothetical protein
MPTTSRWHTAAILVSAPAAAGARADAIDAEEIDELRSLKDEIRVERELLAKEREELKQQRQRVDEALARIDETATAAAAEELPGVSEPGSRARFEIYGFAQVDGIYDFNRVDPDWAATLRRQITGGRGYSNYMNDGGTDLAPSHAPPGAAGPRRSASASTGSSPPTDRPTTRSTWASTAR